MGQQQTSNNRRDQMREALGNKEDAASGCQISPSDRGWHVPLPAEGCLPMGLIPGR